MKLLLDQNLSYRIVKQLTEVYPGSAQVGMLHMGQATDREIWDYAQQHDFAIATLDADFHEYSMLENAPPLVVWLRCGNQPAKVILEKLLHNREVIQQAHDDPATWSVEIY